MTAKEKKQSPSPPPQHSKPGSLSTGSNPPATAAVPGCKSFRALPWRCINRSLCRQPGSAAARLPTELGDPQWFLGRPIPSCTAASAALRAPAWPRDPQTRALQVFPPARSAGPAVGRLDLLISAVSCKRELMSYFRKLILIPGITCQGCLADYPSFLSAYKQWLQSNLSTLGGAVESTLHLV